MNQEFVHALGSILPPQIVTELSIDNTNSFSNSYGNNRGNTTTTVTTTQNYIRRNYCNSTITSNQYGDFVLISNDGQIKYANIRTEVSIVVKVLPIHGISMDELKSYTNIMFDNSGTVLLLWSTNRVGYIEIPRVMYQDNYLNSDSTDDCCQYYDVYSVSDSDGGAIMKVSFHNLNDQHIVILCEKEYLIVMDLRTLEADTITIPRQLRLLSFCFGPDLEWLKFTIFLLTSKGEVYALCPVIPSGTLVSKVLVKHLYDWTLIQTTKNGTSSNTSNIIYCDTVKAYLQKCFGSIDSLSTINPREQYVRAKENDLDDHTYFNSNYRPTLQGPIYQQTGFLDNQQVVQAKTTVKGQVGKLVKDEKVIVCDICVPIIRGTECGLDGAPVIVMSYANGQVDFLLLEPDVRSASTFLAPSWKTIDPNAPNLTFPAPKLLLGERMTIDVPITTTDGNTSKCSWLLTPDPVVSHFIHATDYVLGQSYLMSSSWLHKCLTDVDDVDDTEEMLAKYAGESTKEDIFTENIPSSICIPVFIANKEIEECSTSHEKKSGYGINETKKVHLCGINIVCDPFAGHLAVYRSYSGDITTINLSVHTKLCELEANIATKYDVIESLSNNKELNEIAKNEQNLWDDLSKKILHKISQGLQSPPQVDYNTSVDVRKASVEEFNAVNKKYLMDGANALEQNVLLPMSELGQCNKFHQDMLLDMVDSQHNIIHGTRNAQVTEEYKELTPAAVVSMGLIKAIEQLNHNQEKLKERVANIRETFVEQKELAERNLLIAMSQKTKLSRSEKVYKKQLEEWSASVAMLNDQIQSLKRMTRQPETKTTAPLRSDRGVSLRSVLSSPTPGNSISATNYRTPLGNHSHGRSQGPPLFSITENRSFASPGYGQMGSPIVPLSANKSSMSIVLASPFPTPTRSAVTPGSHLRVTQSQQLATPDKSKDADGGKLALSEEDKQSCLKLLSAQTDLLSNSDEKLKALEQRLLALKARK